MIYLDLKNSMCYWRERKNLISLFCNKVLSMKDFLQIHQQLLIVGKLWKMDIQLSKKGIFYVSCSFITWSNGGLASLSFKITKNEIQIIFQFLIHAQINCLFMMTKTKNLWSENCWLSLIILKTLFYHQFIFSLMTNLSIHHFLMLSIQIFNNLR